MITHKGFRAVQMTPGRIWSDWAVVDLERAVIVAVCSHEREADTICDALWEAVEKRALAPKALLTEGGLV